MILSKGFRPYLYSISRYIIISETLQIRMMSVVTCSFQKINKVQTKPLLFNLQPISGMNMNTSTLILQKQNLSTAWLDSVTISQTKIFQNISQSSYVENIIHGLQYFHDTSAMPWWLTIVTSTILLRLIITFPLAIYQNFIMAKVENLHVEMMALTKELKRETAIAVKIYGWTEKHTKLVYLRSARRIWKELIERDNCHPFKASLLIWAQLPLWILLSISYRNMASMMPINDANAQIIFMELSVGGFGWLPNLTDLDHSLILPVLMGIANLLIIEVNRLSKETVDSRVKKIITNFFRVLSIGLIPVAAFMPGCLVLYWTTSSLFGLAQNLVVLHPKVRRACGIPVSPSEKQHPYKHILSKILRTDSGPCDK